MSRSSACSRTASRSQPPRTATKPDSDSRSSASSEDIQDASATGIVLTARAGLSGCWQAERDAGAALGRFSAQMRPPWASTRPCAIASPRPAPPPVRARSARQNRSNTLADVPAGIPCRCPRRGCTPRAGAVRRAPPRIRRPGYGGGRWRPGWQGRARSSRVRRRQWPVLMFAPRVMCRAAASGVRIRGSTRRSPRGRFGGARGSRRLRRSGRARRGRRRGR